jgi:hypothetical protein
MDKRLFIGIKISPALQREIDRCPREAEHYFKENNPESLKVVTLGVDRLIGTYLQDDFPVSDIDNVSRNVRRLVTLITQGYRLAEDAVRIYADSTAPVVSPVPAP